MHRNQAYNDMQKERYKRKRKEEYEAILELIAKGELTEDALKYNCYTPRLLKSDQSDHPEIKLKTTQEPVEVVTTFDQYRKLKSQWSSYEKQRYIELVKEHGKDYKKISERLQTRDEHACSVRGQHTLAALRHGKMQWDQELFNILSINKHTQKRLF